MEKIRIITDSACDIAENTRADLTILPIQICFGEDSYFDNVTITHKEFYEKLIESDELPSTSLISPAAYEEEFSKAANSGERVIVITLSSKLSGTYQSALVASEGFSDKVAVVDSYNATVGQNVLVKYALELVDEGLPFDEIVSKLEKAKHRIHVIGMLDTLEYLKKGGRISKTVAFVGGALNIKPVLTIKDGAIEMLGKARGSKNGNNLLIEEIKKAGGVDFSKPFCLGYTGISDMMLKKYIEDSRSLWADYTDALPVSTIGATIGTHVGPNAIIVAFFDKA